jgi:hypothetical protein
MHTLRSVRFSHWTRPLSARAAHSIAACTLAFALVTALACDENAPTETRAPAEAPETGGGDEGDALAQSNLSAMAIALPVNQSVATTAPAPAFRINQTGTGPNGIFQIGPAGNTQTALQALTNGRGRAGFFRIQNTLNSQPVLDVMTNGSGSAGLFRASNTSSVSPVVNAVHSGLGPAARFEATNSGSIAPAVEIVSNGGFAESPDRPALALRAVANGPGGWGGYIAVENPTSAGVGLYVTSRGTNYAFYVLGGSFFNGRVHVNGTLTKSAGSFRIDHPLDPEHKYLSHSFVESPDMKNVYDGTVTLDANGRATVDLPEYFEALNRDFRYQLTAIGAPGPNLYVAEGVRQNRFKIAGGRPYATVSWMVTGIRQDTYANEHRIKVEEEKIQPDRELIADR